MIARESTGLISHPNITVPDSFQLPTEFNPETSTEEPTKTIFNIAQLHGGSLQTIELVGLSRTIVALYIKKDKVGALSLSGEITGKEKTLNVLKNDGISQITKAEVVSLEYVDGVYADLKVNLASDDQKLVIENEYYGRGLQDIKSREAAASSSSSTTTSSTTTTSETTTTLAQ